MHRSPPARRFGVAMTSLPRRLWYSFNRRMPKRALVFSRMGLEHLIRLLFFAFPATSCYRGSLVLARTMFVRMIFAPSYQRFTWKAQFGSPINSGRIEVR